MWGKWKRKIDNFIWKEVEEEDNHDYHPSFQDLNPEIKTRIVYQYPNKDSYHIPQIPEQKREINRPMQDMDTPAYLRKGKRLTTPTEETKTYNETIVDTDSRKPFERTDVPSPIYGFRKKDSKEIESVPSFVRKQQNNIVHAEPEVKEVEEVLHKGTDHTNDTKPKTNPSLYNEGNIVNHHGEPEIIQVLDERNEIEIEVQPSLDTVEQELVVQQEEQEPPVKQEEQEQTVKQEEQEQTVKQEEQEQPVKQEEQEPPVKQEELHKDHMTSKKQNSVPFNVMMTPRDKRKLMERNRELKEKQAATQNFNEQTNTTPHAVMNRVSEKGDIPLHLLNDPIQKSNLNDQWIEDQQNLLEQTLKHFHVRARVVNATQGPAVTRFEVHPELGVKVSKVKNLSDDLKLNMSAQDIRIEAPIPGKNTIGIEVPNPKSQMVGLQEILDTDAFKMNQSMLTIALGLNIEGTPVITNIQKMPHGLIAGATGSGKSVCINTILLSLIYKAHHDDVKFLLIDPKMVELAPYNGIPHLVSPVITDVKAATAALKWAVNEMEERYERFVHEGVRDIERYNQRVMSQGRNHEKMPFIVIVIDELADLMMVSPQDVEDAISRIAQKARACGIHLLLATQRPSVDVLTGLIKANIPTRIAFSVSSQIDSRTIIDSGGAEKLLGKGDMLFVENGTGKSVRLQGPFVSDEEIERVTNYVRSIAEPNYLFEQESLLQQFVADEEEDELLEEAIQFIFHQSSASTSLLQRHFKIGYNRAARLMDTLENKGIISGQNGSKPRDVLITKAELEEILS